MEVGDDFATSRAIPQTTVRPRRRSESQAIRPVPVTGLVESLQALDIGYVQYLAPESLSRVAAETQELAASASTLAPRPPLAASVSTASGLFEKPVLVALLVQVESGEDADTDTVCTNFKKSFGAIY